MTKHTPERMEGMKSTAEIRRAYLGLMEETERRETEHLHDVLHYQERVVNLLEVVRLAADNIARHRKRHEAEWDHFSRIYLRQTEGVLREAIAHEEKEGS